MYDSGWALETVRTMTIEEKIAFWRKVMQYAADRGIEVALFTWNIFVYGTETSGYGLTDDPAQRPDEGLRAEIRSGAVQHVPAACRHRHHCGGEHGRPGQRRQRALVVGHLWARREGRDGGREEPGESVLSTESRHSRHPSRASGEPKGDRHTFSQLPGADAADSTLTFSFKYSQAHMYSSTKPLFIYQNDWFNTIPAGKKTWLTVRNDDMYYLRWGDPDFVRAYMTNLPDLAENCGFLHGPRRLHVGAGLRRARIRGRRGGS